MGGSRAVYLGKALPLGKHEIRVKLKDVQVSEDVYEKYVSQLFVSDKHRYMFIPKDAEYFNAYPLGGNGLEGIDVDDRNEYLRDGNSNVVIDNEMNRLALASNNARIPEGVENIGDYSFFGLSGITSITIPSTVNIIGYAFYNPNLESITCLAVTPPSLSGNDALDNTNNCPIYVPSESVDAYKAAYGWSNYASRIQAIPTV